MVADQTTSIIEVLLAGKDEVSKTVKVAQENLMNFQKTVEAMTRAPHVKAMGANLGSLKKELTELSKSAGVEAPNAEAALKKLDKSQLIGNTISAITKLSSQAQELEKFKEIGVVFDNLGRTVDAKTGSLLKMNKVVERLNQRFPRFKTEMLSVMFAAMALQRGLKGLIMPAAETVGVFSIWRTMLEMLFLPIMLALLPFLLKLLNFILELPEGVKLAIGAFALLIIALTTLMVWITILTMAKPGILAFFGLFKPGAAAGIAAKGLAVLKGAFLAVASVVGIVVALVVLFVIGLKDTFGMFVESIKSMFKGAFDMISGVFGIFRAILTGDMDLLVESIKKIFNGFLTFLGGLVKTILLIPITIINGFLKLVDWILSKFGINIGLSKIFMDWVRRCFEIFDRFLERTKELFATALNWIRDRISNHLERIRNMWNTFTGGITTAFNVFSSTIRRIWDTMWGILRQVVENVVRPIGTVIQTVFGTIRSAIDSIMKPIDWLIDKLQRLWDVAGGVISFLGGGIFGGIGGTLSGILGLAEGGIVTRPTFAQIGEKGPEAVIPLDKLNQFEMGGFNPTININANVSSDIDIRTLARRLSIILDEEYRRRR